MVGRLKQVIRPFLLQRTADWVFRTMTEEKIIWLPLSPWQKAVYDAVCEKDVERWAGILQNSGMNNLYSKLKFTENGLHTSSKRVESFDVRSTAG